MGKQREKAQSTVSACVAPALSAEVYPLWHKPYIQVLIILAVGFAIYFNSLGVPFQFDDNSCLVHNRAIRDFGYFFDHSRLRLLPILQDIKNNFVLRPVAYFSFAINYKLHGLAVWGYHVVNIAIHLLNALLIYLLISLTLSTWHFSNRLAESNRLLRTMPLFAALLFVAHPLQTQAVTYIIQRITSMSTLFYLAAMVLFVKARLSKHGLTSNSCYLLSVASAVLAMETKEIAFTLPLIITLYEWIFFSGDLKKRILRLVPFLLTMAIIPYKVSQLATVHPSNNSVIGNAINLINFKNFSSWDYLMTQFGVITTYLRLLVLPIGQNLDYDYPLETRFFQSSVLQPLLLLILLFGVAVYLQFRSGTRDSENPLSRIVSFGIFWFFITLSVESSIIPIEDFIFEHRVYLPSIGIFMAFIAAIGMLYKGPTHITAVSPVTVILSIVLAMLSISTLRRNAVWKNEVTLWQDAARKSPYKARPHTNLGLALLEAGRFDESIRESETALTLDYTNGAAHNNLGVAFLAQKQFDSAARHFVTALILLPQDTEALVNLSLVQIEQGKLEQARVNIEAAMRIDPGYSKAHAALGSLLEKEGRIEEARITKSRIGQMLKVY